MYNREACVKRLQEIGLWLGSSAIEPNRFHGEERVRKAICKSHTIDLKFVWIVRYDLDAHVSSIPSFRTAIAYRLLALYWGNKIDDNSGDHRNKRRYRIVIKDDCGMARKEGRGKREKED